MFSLTGITKLQKGLLPAKNALTAYSGMFQDSSISEIESGAFGFSVVQSFSSIFKGCPITHLYEGSIPTCRTSGNGAFSNSFESCLFSTIDPKWFDITPGVYCTYQGMFSSNKLLETVEESLFRSLKLGGKTSGRQFQAAFAYCTSLKKVDIPYVNSDFFGNNTSRPDTFREAFKGCTSLENISVRFTKWSYIAFNDGQEKNFTLGWLTDVAPTGTFICPIELAEATDGYYDEDGNFIEGVGRGPSTIPEGWEIDPIIIDARDGDANAMALMAVISQQTHADGTPWVKDSLVMMKSEAEKVESIKTVFAYGNCSAKDYTCMQYFVNSNFPNYCFARSKMEKVTLPNTLSTISTNALQETLIDHINLPDSVTTILGGAFYGVINLKSIDFNKVTKLDGYNHFFGSGLESVYIPKTLTIGSGSFRNCAYLESIIVEEGHPTYDSRENCNAIIQKSNNSLIVGCNTTIIPDGVTSIGRSAFNESQISYIDIPASVTSIGWGAFQNCKSLQTVILRKSTRYTINAEDFQNVPATFYVPDELLDGYKTAAVWSTFADRIKPLSDYTG